MSDSEYLMNDIPHGTSFEDILCSLATPVHDGPQLNYELILKMLENQPTVQDSKLDNSLSVARHECDEIR